MAGLTLTGTAGNDRLEGGPEDDMLSGLGGDDVLIGAGGADILDGGPGDDTFYLDNPGDALIEAIGGGRDRAVTSISYTLPANVEIEILEALARFDPAEMNLAGNAFANALIGSQGANRLDGGAGDDDLQGFGGADILIGGAGEDSMRGGEGDDIYYVDNIADGVIENFNEGSDRVAAAITFALPQGASIEALEALDYASVDAIDLVGSDYDNKVVGNAGANTLNGRSGDDQLFGEAGDDVLIGGDGNDRFFGGAGRDVLVGGRGDDTFYVDDSGDKVLEGQDDGNDRVATSVSFSLDDGVGIEILEAVDLRGFTQIDLAGNEFAQTIRGNLAVNYLTGDGGNDVLVGFGGDDILFGGSGADTMFGGPGSDTYYVDDTNDVTYEEGQGGRDRVATSVDFVLSSFFEIEVVEAITLSDTTPIKLFGGGTGALLIGNAGENMLDTGGTGGKLVGMGGSDSFAFTSRLVLDTFVTIADFGSGMDRIVLDSRQFVGLTPGSLPDNVFSNALFSPDADDRIIFDTPSRVIYYDPDGSGPTRAFSFAFLDNGGTVVAADFFVI